MATLPAGFSADNAGKPYSLTNPEPGVLRFEVRKGDVYTGFNDRGNERNEIKDNARYPISEALSIRYPFMIEAGAPITASWMVIGQVHAALNQSPPIEICFNGNDRLKVNLKGPSATRTWQDSKPIARGVYHTVRLDIVWGVNGGGKARVWFNDDLVLDYEGALGYSGQTHAYWRCGVYRNTAPETFAVRMGDLRIIRMATREEYPAPVPEPVEPEPDPIEEEDYLVDMVLSMGAWAQSIEDRLKALETK